MRDIHRIGGRAIDHLRLKPAEGRLTPPGISVLCGPTAAAADQMRRAFPAATQLADLARTVGSSNADLIRAAGFDLRPDPTRKFPNHFRIIHPPVAAGFGDAGLAALGQASVDTTGL